MVQKKGFTLIEVLVAIALSGVVITALLGAFFSFIEYQASSQDQRDAFESVRFFLTDLSREMSFGSNYACSTANYPVTDSGGNTVANACKCVTFTDQLFRTTKIRYNSVTQSVEKSVQLLDRNPSLCAAVNDVNDPNTWAPLIDYSVNVTDLVFETEANRNKQPRVRMKIDADYTVDGVTESISAKTQVTRRIIEPNRNILDDFRVGIDVAAAARQHYFIYAACPAGSTRCTAGDSVCQDERGTVYGATQVCDEPQRPVAAEFTEHGLYVLTENGLVFFIPKSHIVEGTRANPSNANAVLKATGQITNAAGTVTTAKKLIPTATVQSEVSRVIGSGGCRLCANDPNSIVSIHPREKSVSALGNTGALYQLNTDGTGTPPNPKRSIRLLAGGTANAVKHISTDTARRTLFLFNDSTGTQKVRLSSRHQLIAGDVGDTSCLTEFQFVSSTADVCRQVQPDSVTSSVTVTPASLNTTFGPSGTPLSFIDRLQTINETVHLWYSDKTGKHLLSVDGTADITRNSSTNADALDTLLAGMTGDFAYGNGVTVGNVPVYTFPCGTAGNALCKIDSFNDTVFAANTDRITMSTADGRVNDHIHFKGYPIGISDRGRLLYFTGIGTATGKAKALQVFSKTVQTDAGGTVTNTQRALCGAVPYRYNDPGASSASHDQQVFFEYISRKHPTEDIVALIGAVFDQGSAAVPGGAVHEIYLLVPTTLPTASSRKAQYSDDDVNVVCGTPHVERYHLPTDSGGPALDLVRLTGLRFVDTPTP